MWGLYKAYVREYPIDMRAIWIIMTSFSYPEPKKWLKSEETNPDITSSTWMQDHATD